MEIVNEFIFYCYQLEMHFGKGKLIDSNFSKNEYISDETVIIPLPELQERLESLRKTCVLSTTLDESTRLYLVKHIDALIMQIRMRFEQVDYVETISVLYDINAEQPNKDVIDGQHERLNELLSKCGINEGTLNKRVADWNAQFAVSADEYLLLANKKVQEFSDRTKKLLSDIIDYSSIDDKLELKCVKTDQGWGAYNYYLGNYSGIIEFNTQASFNKFSLNTFISHEGYPGHHTSCLVKEYLYKSHQINSLASINLLYTPSSLIEEGIGDSGLTILGIMNNDHNSLIEQALSELSTEAYYYAAYSYYQEKKKEKDIIRILIDDKLHCDEKSALRALAFIKNWGYYIPTYKYGKKIVSSFVQQYGRRSFPVLYKLCCNSIIEKWSGCNETDH